MYLKLTICEPNFCQNATSYSGIKIYYIYIFKCAGDIVIMGSLCPFNVCTVHTAHIFIFRCAVCSTAECYIVTEWAALMTCYKTSHYSHFKLGGVRDKSIQHTVVSPYFPWQYFTNTQMPSIDFYFVFLEYTQNNQYNSIWNSSTHYIKLPISQYNDPVIE